MYSCGQAPALPAAWLLDSHYGHRDDDPTTKPLPPSYSSTVQNTDEKAQAFLYPCPIPNPDSRSPFDAAQAIEENRLFEKKLEKPLISLGDRLGHNGVIVRTSRQDAHSQHVKRACRRAARRSLLAILLLILAASFYAALLPARSLGSVTTLIRASQQVVPYIMDKLLQLVTLASPAIAAVIGRQATETPAIAASASCPTDASPIIDPSFPGYAFELASVVEYATDASGNPNVFSQNLINAINSKTGGAPIVRFGGTSGDFAILVEDQTEPALPVAAADNYQNVGGTTIGPSFWPLLLNFPNAKYIFQIPLGIDEIENALNWTTSGVAALGLDKIDAFEIGNEPDLYPNTNDANMTLEPPTYQGELSDTDYVYKWGAFSSAISAALDLPKDVPLFQAFDTSVHFDSTEATVFDVPAIFGDGLNANNTVKLVSHHYYQTDGTQPFAQGLLNHSNITTHLDYYRPFIDFLQSSTDVGGKPIPFVIGEIGNSLNRFHDYGYQASLAAALWAVDFSLYGMAIGVARIYWQQIMHSGFDLWLPVDSAGVPAQTFSTFYGVLFSAEFIGTSGNTRVTVLPIDKGPANVIAYAAYDNDALARIAIVNLNEYEGKAKDPKDRPATTLVFNGLDDCASVSFKSLSSPDGAGALADKITFGGSQWTYASGGQEVMGVEPSGVGSLEVKDGTVVVGVEDSSAVLLFLEK